MPGFDGTGPRGMGPMTGGGRGFCSPWGIGAATRGYRLPRGVAYPPRYYGAYGFGPFPSMMTREQEVEFLKNEAQALRDELDGLEERIEQLSAKKD